MENNTVKNIVLLIESGCVHYSKMSPQHILVLFGCCSTLCACPWSIRTGGGMDDRTGDGRTCGVLLVSLASIEIKHKTIRVMLFCFAY